MLKSCPEKYKSREIINPGELMGKRYAIILAGGRGQRAGGDMPKQFIKINSIPLIIITMRKFDNMPEIDGIIPVIPEDYIHLFEKIAEESGLSKIIRIIPGGETRQGSSFNAVTGHDYNDDDLLILHDAARPFISEDIIRKCIDEAENHGASGVYVKSVDTIAVVHDGFVESITPREKFYATQTPQCFKYSIIRKAHEDAGMKNITDATDDVRLAIDAGFRVKIVNGESGNIKITTHLDLELAELILSKSEE